MLDFNFNLPTSFSFTSSSTKAQLALIHKATCFFQEHFVDFSIVASAKHKELRLAWESDSRDMNLIQELAESLVNHCNQKLRAASEQTANYIHQYFEIDGREPTCKTRFCIKVAFDGNIEDVFRDKGVMLGYRFPIEKNTGFDEVLKTGHEFLCNTIPKDTKNGSYTNLRINKKLAKQYKSPGFFKRKGFNSSAGKCSDPDWMKCWDTNDDVEPKPESCYKSTLIIPMTLAKADASNDLRKTLKMDEGYEKTTYGYICLDHVHENFFHKPEDIDVGYFFADLLSLYLVNRLNYIINSNTFNEVLSKLYSSITITEESPLFIPELSNNHPNKEGE